MASLMRPGLLRQACQAPAFQQRFLSTAVRQSSPLAQSLRPAFSAPSAIHKATRIAAFHATQRQQILPPLPQKIEGTLNDPVKVPTPEYAHGSYHWTFERYGTPFVWRRGMSFGEGRGGVSPRVLEGITRLSAALE